MKRVTTYLVALLALMATSVIAQAAKPAATTQQFGEPNTVTGTIMDFKEVMIDDMKNTDPSDDKKQLKIRFKLDEEFGGNTIILTICNKECWSDYATQGACVVCSSCLYDICKTTLSNDTGKRARLTYVESKGTNFIWADCKPNPTNAPCDPTFTACNLSPFGPMCCRCYEPLD